MAFAQVRTKATQSQKYSFNGIMVPYQYANYDIDKILSQGLINLYHGITIGALEVGPDTPNAVADIYDHIRLNTPNTEIIMTEDPYDALGNVVRFLSSVDDSIGRDGDVLISTADYKMYKRENGLYSFKFQMQGGSGGVAVAAKWFFGSYVNNSIGSDGDLLILPTGALYKKISGSFVYQMTIAGPAGTSGSDGLNGTTIYLSSTDPYVGTGIKAGDLNIVDSAYLYSYSGNAWIFQGSIKGATGLKGDKGDIGDSPSMFVTDTYTNATGANGDILLNPVTFMFYKKIAGVWVYQSTMSTPEGSIWRHNTVVDNSIGKNGDWLLIDTGDAHEKVAGTYVFRVNIKGPIGLTGNVGAAGTDGTDGANGTNGTNGINGINGTDGAPGSKIYFLATVNNSIGIDGDVVISGSDIYQKDGGIYVLKGSTGSGDGTGSGFNDWIILENKSPIPMPSTYTKLSDIKKVDKLKDSLLYEDLGSIAIISGGWDFSIDVLNSSSCNMYLKITVGSDTLLEKYIQSESFSFRKYFFTEVDDTVEVFLYSENGGTIPIGGINLGLFNIKIPDITNAVGYEVLLSLPDYRYIYTTNTTNIIMPSDGSLSALTTTRPNSTPYSAISNILGVDTLSYRLTSQYIKIQGLSTAGLEYYGNIYDFTIGCFIKPIAIISATSFQIFTFQNDSSCGENSISVDDNGKIMLTSDMVSPCDGLGPTNTTSVRSIEMGVWSCITYSYQASTRTQNIFVNGELYVTYTVPRDLSSIQVNKLVINGVNNDSYGSSSSGDCWYADIRIKRGLFINSEFEVLPTLGQRNIPPTILIDPPSCGKINRKTVMASTSSTSLPMGTTLKNVDILDVELTSDTIIIIESALVDGKRVRLYIRQDSASANVYSISMTNLLFENMVLPEDIVYSTIAGEIDMIGLEYDSSRSKWMVLSFVKGVY